jgi:hypothetical protein
MYQPIMMDKHRDWWSDNWQKKIEVPGENLLHFYSVYHSFNMHCPEIEPRPPP